MSPLTKLKNYYTLSEAALRLSESFGEPVSQSDIFQFVLAYRMKLSLRFVRQYAVPVAPVMTCFWRAKKGSVGQMGCPPADAYEHWWVEMVERQGDMVEWLSGCYHLWNYGESSRRELAHLAALAFPTSTKVRWDDPVGVCVVDAYGIPYQVVDERGKDQGVEILDGLGYGNLKWQPVRDAPSLDQFVIQTQDLLDFELATIGDTTGGLERNSDALHGKERAHYLKVIAALLSKAKISKSEPVTQVLMMLESAGQTSINRETLGKTLNDANALRQ